jgi:hypothetical protein
MATTSCPGPVACPLLRSISAFRANAIVRAIRVRAKRNARAVSGSIGERAQGLCCSVGARDVGGSGRADGRPAGKERPHTHCVHALPPAAQIARDDRRERRSRPRRDRFSSGAKLVEAAAVSVTALAELVLMLAAESQSAAVDAPLDAYFLEAPAIAPAFLAELVFMLAFETQALAEVGTRLRGRSGGQDQQSGAEIGSFFQPGDSTHAFDPLFAQRFAQNHASVRAARQDAPTPAPERRDRPAAGDDTRAGQRMRLPLECAME